MVREKVIGRGTMTIEGKVRAVLIRERGADRDLYLSRRGTILAVRAARARGNRFL